MIALIDKVVKLLMGHHNDDADSYLVEDETDERTPSWAADLIERFGTVERLVLSLHRKVYIFMSQDRDNLARLTAVVAGLLPVMRAVIQERDDLKAQNAQQATQLGQAQADAASDAADDTAAQQPLSDALDALDTLVNGPKTPDVAPVPPEEAPAVVDGSQDVTAPDGSALPTADDGTVASDDEV